MRMRRALFTVIVVIALTVTGCTTMHSGETRSVEQMVAAAGFQMTAADTPKKASDLKMLPVTPTFAIVST